MLANPGVDPWLPGVGREVVVPTQFILPAAPREGVVVDVAAMRIFYYPRHKKGEQQVVYTHPIGIGRVGWKTPEGTTKIVSRTKDPVWVVPKSVREEHAEDGEKLPAVVPAGPDNPLGQYMFRLTWPSYLIHGTNKPYGVGMRSSHGCIRLYPEDIAVFFDLIPIGTKVTVVNQPYLFGWRDGTLYFSGLCGDGRRFARLEQEPQAPARAHLESESAAARCRSKARYPTRTTTSIGSASGTWPTRRVRCPCRSPEVMTASMRWSRSRCWWKICCRQGSNWDGKTGLLVDEKTFNDLVNGQQSKTPPMTASPSSTQ